MKIEEIVSEGEERTHGYFDEKFPGHYAQISTVLSLKLKSAILNVARSVYGKGKIPGSIAGLTKKLPNTPQGVSCYNFVYGYDDSGVWKEGLIKISKPLQEYIKKYPDQWETVLKALKLGSGFGRHASAYVLTGRPLEGYIPTVERAGMLCTQYEAVGVEFCGAIKYDFLVINSLNDLQGAIRLIQERSGREIPETFKTKLGNTPKCYLVPIGDTFYHTWALPTDLAVYDDICQGRTETVFQLNTSGAKKWLKYFSEPDAKGELMLKSIIDLAIFTSLDRPGPLDVELESPNGGTHNALVEYVRRKTGQEPSPSILPVFDTMFPETLGVLTFQEQVQKGYKYLTDCSGTEADEFRSSVGKKKKEKIIAAYPKFIERATVKLGSKELAEEVWRQFTTFGAYGFCLLGSQLVQTKDGVVKFEDLKPGMKVKSFCEKTNSFEYIEPSAFMDMGQKEVFEVALEDGSLIQATMDHKFLYEGAWVCLSDLILLGHVETQQEKNVPMRQSSGKQHTPLSPKIKPVRPSKRRKRKKTGNLQPQDQSSRGLVINGRTGSR